MTSLPRIAPTGRPASEGSDSAPTGNPWPCLTRLLATTVTSDSTRVFQEKSGACFTWLTEYRTFNRTIGMSRIVRPSRPIGKHSEIQNGRSFQNDHRYRVRDGRAFRGTRPREKMDLCCPPRHGSTRWLVRYRLGQINYLALLDWTAVDMYRC